MVCDRPSKTINLHFYKPLVCWIDNAVLHRSSCSVLNPKFPKLVICLLKKRRITFECNTYAGPWDEKHLLIGILQLLGTVPSYFWITSFFLLSCHERTYESTWRNSKFGYGCTPLFPLNTMTPWADGKCFEIFPSSSHLCFLLELWSWKGKSATR